MKSSSAFPVIAPSEGPIMTGLSKREYASIKFMQSLIGRWADCHDNKYVPAQGSSSVKELAAHSIELADELLKQLEL